MFSTLMLHWNLYAALPDQHRVSLTEWVELNAGLEGDGNDIPSHVQHGIFKALQGGCIPQLQIVYPGTAPAAKKKKARVLATNGVVLESWARLPRQCVRPSQ